MSFLVCREMDEVGLLPFCWHFSYTLGLEDLLMSFRKLCLAFGPNTLCCISLSSMAVLSTATVCLSIFFHAKKLWCHPPCISKCLDFELTEFIFGFVVGSDILICCLDLHCLSTDTNYHEAVGDLLSTQVYSRLPLSIICLAVSKIL